MSKSADRAAEFNRLLVEQSTLIRSMKHGYRPDEATDQLSKDRASRLVELAELLGEKVRGGLEPENYVNARISAWLQANPLALTSERVREVIDSFRNPNPDTHVTCGVFVAIGDLKNGGYYYRAMANDLEAGHSLVLKVPESVAEHFRQQGYRRRSREISRALGFKLEY